MEETEALAIVFGDWQGDVDYQKWWRSLGVNPPGDYTDPELLFDQLPQPYRTITKVLEQDIIDPSWDIITDRHPELLLVQPENHTGPLLEPREREEQHRWRSGGRSCAPAAGICGVDGNGSLGRYAPTAPISRACRNWYRP